jgi:hypothetical protein
VSRPFSLPSPTAAAHSAKQQPTLYRLFAYCGASRSRSGASRAASAWLPERAGRLAGDDYPDVPGQRSEEFPALAVVFSGELGVAILAVGRPSFCGQSPACLNRILRGISIPQPASSLAVRLRGPPGCGGEVPSPRKLQTIRTSRRGAVLRVGGASVWRSFSARGSAGGSSDHSRCRASRTSGQVLGLTFGIG